MNSDELKKLLDDSRETRKLQQLRVLEQMVNKTGSARVKRKERFKDENREVLARLREWRESRK